MKKNERRVQIGASISVTSICLAEKMLKNKVAPNLSRLIDVAIKEYAKSRKIELNNEVSM